METSTAILSLLMGFTGSLHCAGMCGPIVWIMPFQSFSGFKRVLAVSLYHVGRISAYALLAVALHSFRGLFTPRIQQYISIILGIALLAAGLISFFSSRLHFAPGLTKWIQNQLGKTIGRPGLSPITLAGFLNGLLPCGLVYMALSAAVVQSSALHAVAFMYVFGAGTLPMLLSITLLKTKVSFLKSAHLKKLVPVTVFFFGCIFVLRGMSLGIPYLSPKVDIQHNLIHSCCHKM